MKLSIKTFAILFAAATIYSCNSDTSTTATSPDTTGSDKPAAMDTSHMNDTPGATATTGTTASSAEQDFLNFAIPANEKEIIWLNAGLAKGSKEIKAHSSMMLKDHKKLGATVKEFMSKKSTYTMPAVDTANTVTINDKTGADWDKAWLDKMSDDHNALLDKLKKAQDDVKDEELKKIVTSTIPVVESHISMVKAAQAKSK